MQVRQHDVLLDSKAHLRVVCIVQIVAGAANTYSINPVLSKRYLSRPQRVLFVQFLDRGLTSCICCDIKSLELGVREALSDMPHHHLGGSVAAVSAHPPHMTHSMSNKC